MNLIDETISTTTPLSKEIDGGSLSPFSESGQGQTAALQIIPSSDGDFEVEIEGAVNTPGGSNFTTIGRYTQSDDALMTIFPIGMAALYRFRHVSGIDTRVIMKG